jgi:hypothetical protein
MAARPQEENVMRSKALGLLVGASLGLLSTNIFAGDDNSLALPYPNVVDTSHASKEVADILRSYFTAKSDHDVSALMKHFSFCCVEYIDASSGGAFNWAALNALFQAVLPTRPPTALSYPLRIIGDRHSALVAFVDTPDLFGSELRILGSVTFDKNEKIIRWVDYWDGRSSLIQNTIKPTYPTDFRDDVEDASALIRSKAQALQTAFGANDVTAASALFSPDAVYEDMALHAQILGRLAIQRYLTRALPSLPYGIGASVAHVEGSDQGGGYEWLAAVSASPMRRGHTAIELDATGQITRLTAVYDSSLLSDGAYTSLVELAAE